MTRNKPMESSETSRKSSGLGLKIVELGFLLWMLCITIMWWLLYGPGMTLLTERLGILPELREIRAFLSQLVTFTSWY